MARGPDFDPQQVTHYTKDNGLELIDLKLSPDGRYLVYVRGGDEHQNWPGDGHLQPDPSSLPHQVFLELWSVSLSPHPAKPVRLALHARHPMFSPDGKSVVFYQILKKKLWTVPVDGRDRAKEMFWNRGRITSPQWSPDGSKLAFVTWRGDHSFIGIYRGADRPIEYLDPKATRDSNPRWSPDGKSIAFIRRPGSAHMPEDLLKRQPRPWSIWVADADSGKAHAVWESPKTLHGSYPGVGEPGGANLQWMAGNHLTFVANTDGWPHLYSLKLGRSKPRLLTPGNYMVEYVQASPNKQFIVYDANTGPDRNDTDRRHIFMVPVDKGRSVELTKGVGLEWTPVVTSDSQHVAFIGAGAKRPPLPAILNLSNRHRRALSADSIPDNFPTSSLAIPQKVVLHSTDGFTIHCQRFEPRDTTSEGKRPAIIYVHGGPSRQMFLGWHYARYYDNDYAVNQYLVAHGFIVLSVNYRRGVGYGWDFHNPAHAGWKGAAEYADVLTAAHYLQHDPNVNASKIGIWGGSYGGFLTSMALAKNSDIFAAGVDRHGVENWPKYPTIRTLFQRYKYMNPYRQTDFKRAIKTAWLSSPDAWVQNWKSPVMLIQGDDDRNVPFHDMVGLVALLRKYHVPFQQRAIPDEVHTMLRYRSWLEADTLTVRFFKQHFQFSRHVAQAPETLNGRVGR